MRRVITAMTAMALLTGSAGPALAESFNGTGISKGTPVDTTTITQPTETTVPPTPVDPGTSTDPTKRDGTTADKALASCWDVKQTNPAAADGLYWLYTPALGAPARFYCDMTTDGGGWVLIGRGREGWSFLEEGQGAASEVSSVVTGTAAFAPKLLTGATVRGLLNNGAPQDLADGLRVRRASNATGTTWQDVRLKPTRFPNWRWVLNGTYPVSTVSFNGVVYNGTFTTQNASVDNGFRTITTSKTKLNTALPGFSYGAAVTGSNAADSYLWSPTSTGPAVPFAQLFLRPMLRFTDLSFPAVTSVGSSTITPVMSNLAQPQTAGVSGLANGFTTERDTEVRSMVQIGSTMYVGGNFAQVDNYATGTSTPQPYLAAFDVKTGSPVPGFAPKLNGKVNSLVKLPSGALAVGGEFTTVNGVTRAGLVALDPATGATISSFVTDLQLRSGTTTSPGTVTSMSVLGNTLYLGGSFTHSSGGGAGYAYTKRGGRLDATTGRPDAAWNPAFNGTPIFVMASQRGDRVYYGGFMTTMNDDANPAKYFAAITTATPAAPVAGLMNPIFSATWITYQQTATEVGDKLWLGGSEHAFFMYNRATMALERGNIAASDSGSGGDFQASAVDGNVIYGSCHCILSNNMGDGRAWPTSPTFDDIDSIRYIAAYDATTAHNLPAFLPQMRTRAIRGPWSLVVDSNGCLWAGGDTSETKSTSGSWQRSGGFARHCRVDSIAPAKASAIKAVDNGNGTLSISWTGAESGLTFRLYRGNTVVWSGTSWKATIPLIAGSTYALDSIDKAGNTSGTTTPVTLP